MENKFKYIDSENNIQEVTIDKSDFEFVQKDKEIHDLKLQGKPTTFFKDAMHRFVKTKPAVVGGVILGFIILCAIFLPMVMPNYGCYDVSTTHLLNGGGIKSEVSLPPKLFDAGLGWWDGTIKKTGIAYDQTNEQPVGYEARTVSNLEKSEYYEDFEGKYGSGGYLNLTYKNETTAKYGDLYSQVYNYDFSNDYTISYRFEVPTASGYKATSYRISLITLDAGVKTYYPLTGTDLDFVSFSEEADKGLGFVSDLYTSDQEGTKTIDVSATMKKYGVETLEKGRINIDILKEDGTEKSSIYVKNLLISSKSDVNEDDNVSLRSIKDANNNMIQEQKIQIGTTIDKKDNPAYWTTKNGSRSCLHVKFVKCNFVYDMYEDCYGVKEMTIQAYKITEWMNAGYLTFTPNKEATTDTALLNSLFESLSDANPIVTIKEQIGTPKWSVNEKAYSGYSLVCEVSQYKYLGYSSAPKYFFGTDSYGRDFLKTIATSLRLSLVIAFGVAGINIIFGLIWGSISGYFGGWTDIVMERFCDILGGLPSVAIITLSIFYLHNDMLAFILSMFLTGWMGVAGRTRTQFYRFKNREYVLASRTLGAKNGRLIFRHILPNSLGTIITSSILMIPSVIYSEASIAYLGLGLKNQLLFGVILSENRNFFNDYTMYLLIIPTVIMAFLLISFNLFGNGLRDAFNPSLKGSE